MTRPLTASTAPSPATIQQFTRIEISRERPRCQICKKPLSEGTAITAYGYRAAGEPTVSVGYVLCGSDVHQHPQVFTRGVSEWLLGGHVGQWSNSTTQTHTAILANPEPLVASGHHTTAATILKPAVTEREPTGTTREKTPLSLAAALTTQSHHLDEPTTGGGSQ